MMVTLDILKSLISDLVRVLLLLLLDLHHCLSIDIALLSCLLLFTNLYLDLILVILVCLIGSLSVLCKLLFILFLLQF